MSEEATGRAKGGIARREALTPEQRKKIASDAATARWNNDLPKATHEGVMQIGNVEIACAVLEDGRRLITQSGFMKALGRARQAKGRDYYEGDVNLPAFLTAKNLKPYISKDLEVTSSQLEFKPIKGARAYGYAADLLPQVLDVFLDADEAGALTAMQEHIAARAKILIRGLARVGIAALVDEATGYQEVRDRQALQQILDRYLTAEKAKWAKTFPDDFYRKLFTVRGLPYDPTTTKRPGFIGNDTNTIVYERLAPGILKKLHELNPKTEKGYRKEKHHQHFTPDYGLPELKSHVEKVMFLMDAAGPGNFKQFKLMLERAAPKQGDTIPLDLDEPN